MDASLRWHDEVSDFSGLEQVKWLIKFILGSSESVKKKFPFVLSKVEG